MSEIFASPTAKSNRSQLMYIIFLILDGMLYAGILHFVVYTFSDKIPRSIVYNLNIVLMVGLLCFYLTSVLLPLQVTKRRTGFNEVIRRSVTVSVLTQCLFAILWYFVTSNSGKEINFALLMTASLVVSLCALRAFESLALKQLRRVGRNQRSVCFFGEDSALLNLYNEMMLNPETGYNVVGYFGDAEIVDAPASLKHLGTRQDFLDIANGKKTDAIANTNLHQVDEMYCCVSRQDYDILRFVIRFCDKAVVRFFYVPRIYNTRPLSLKPELVGNIVMYTNHYEPLSHMSNRFIKRTFDIVTSAIVCLCLLPFIPIIAFLIKRQSPGPIFFSQIRTGLAGRDFKCYKFRSMHINADCDTMQATKDDPRKFPFGNFMREHNIDELPQFFNVLKGDMSIVGPRPHMKLHTEQYSAIIEQYMVRHFEKPGITGLAQVTGFRGETKELKQMEGRIERDVWYIEHWSFLLDIKICWLTAIGFFIKDNNAY